MSRFLAWGLVASLSTSPLHAQRVSALRAGITEAPSCAGSRHPFFSEGSLPSMVSPAQRGSAPSPWSVALSAILPGSGQALVGSNRAVPYLAIEAFAWTSFVRHSLQYRRRRDGYRNVAANVARAPFSDVRPNGDFEYYEHMTHYQESGRFDIVPADGIQPESDTTTYNGAVWLLARRTYWTNPTIAPDTSSDECLRAMAFYKARAYDQLYRWSWGSAPQQYAAFLALIDGSNDANRRAMLDLGVVIANHVLSTVDAYITLRLRHDPLRREFAVEGQLPMPRVLR